jgi:hypothetical protein
MRRSLLWLLPILLTGCTRLDVIAVAPQQTMATWITIQPLAVIKIGALEIIVAKKGYFSFQEAGLIP